MNNQAMQYSYTDKDGVTEVGIWRYAEDGSPEVIWKGSIEEAQALEASGELAKMIAGGKTFDVIGRTMPVVVAEEGPELFTPGRTGRVTGGKTIKIKFEGRKDSDSE